MKIGDVANRIGLTDLNGYRAVLMTLSKSGKPKHVYCADVVDTELSTDIHALYAASGLFNSGSIAGNEGRTVANLARVLWLPFDADLLDYLGCEAGDDRKRMMAELGAMPQAELDGLIASLRSDLEETFAALGVPIHRLDYTGYGLCAYVYLDEADRERVSDARAAHKIVVKALNTRAGHKLVDEQVNDAGTRVTRLPGSVNHKGAIPRLVTSLIPYDGVSTYPLGQRPNTAKPHAQSIPLDGDGVADADVDALIDAVAPSFGQGQRHAITLALAGMLAKAGVPESQATEIVARLWSANQASGWLRQPTVETTYRRMRAGGIVQGYVGLRERIPSAALDTVDRILSRFAKATRGSVSVGAMHVTGELKKPLVFTAPPTVDVPDVCYAGWFKSYVDLVEPLCESPRSFHLASALVLAGATLGRSVCARYVSKNVYGNTYMMLVGLAGSSRKDTAIEIALDLPNHRAPNYMGLTVGGTPYKQLTDVGSAEGLISVLSKTPNALLYVTEYQRLAQNAKRQNSTIFPLLTAAWNAPRIVENITKGNPLEAKFPYLSIIAAVQPGILAQEMRQADIESGFATRWLFVTGEGKDEGIADPDDIDEAVAWKLYHELISIRKHYEEEHSDRGEARLQLSKQARERWTNWYHKDRKRQIDSEDEASMRSRLGTHVRKIALLYAASSGASAIDDRHLEAAIAFVEWSWANTRALMRNWGVSVWLQIENKIETVLKQHGAILRKDLAYKCRGRQWSAREFAQVLDAMLKNGTVEMTPTGIFTWAE